MKGWKGASTENQASPRSSHSLTHASGKIYVMGGELQPRVPIGSDVRIYDLESDTWLDPVFRKWNRRMVLTSSALNPPSLRVAHGAAAIGEEIFLFGGRNDEKAELGDFWKWNTRSQEWTELFSSTPGPVGRSYHGTVAVQDKLYIFGGCSAAGRQNDLWRYDPDTNTWTEMPSAGAPSARGGPAVVATESEIYVFYGFNGTELSDIFAFDINAGAWREVATTGDIPSPRSVHAAAYLGNRQIFLWGGEGSPSALGHEGAGQHFGDGFILDIDTNVWAKIPAQEGAPNPRGWLAATSFPGGAAIFGGLADDNVRQADLYLYRQ